mmetsp:Transcript_16608/g.23571  ORF Transcript_16608/g.23571 Transcript_16608/m.23571 type:complete len:320 (-) Transcript_16608:1552-2511(-)
MTKQDNQPIMHDGPIFECRDRALGSSNIEDVEDRTLYESAPPPITDEEPQDERDDSDEPSDMADILTTVEVINENKESDGETILDTETVEVNDSDAENNDENSTDTETSTHILDRIEEENENDAETEENSESEPNTKPGHETEDKIVTLSSKTLTGSSDTDSQTRYNLRSTRSRGFNKHIGQVDKGDDFSFTQTHEPTDMMSKIVNIVFTQMPERYAQMSTNKGFKVFGERAIVALFKEYQQLYDKLVFQRIKRMVLTDVLKKTSALGSKSHQRKKKQIDQRSYMCRRQTSTQIYKTRGGIITNGIFGGPDKHVSYRNT